MEESCLKNGREILVLKLAWSTSIYESKLVLFNMPNHLTNCQHHWFRRPAEEGNINATMTALTCQLARILKRNAQQCKSMLELWVNCKKVKSGIAGSAHLSTHRQPQIQLCVLENAVVVLIIFIHPSHCTHPTHIVLPTINICICICTWLGLDSQQPAQPLHLLR